MKLCAGTAKRSIVAAVWAAAAWGISAAPSAKSKATVPKYFREWIWRLVTRPFAVLLGRVMIVLV